MARRTRPAGKPAYHHGDLRTALLDAGETLLAEKGPAALSLRELARTCGVSQAAPYRHFKDRDAILNALAIRAFKEFGDALTAASTGVADPGKRLQALGRAYVHYGLAHPHRLRLMFGTDGKNRMVDEHLAEVAGAGYGLLEQTVAEILPPRSKKLRAATVSAWSLVHGFTVLNLDLPSEAMAESVKERDSLLGTILEEFTAGLSRT